MVALAAHTGEARRNSQMLVLEGEQVSPFQGRSTGSAPPRLGFVKIAPTAIEQQ
jgi:hypothetical protein